MSKLNLVDLAGTERQSKTGAEGKCLQEANKINLSLSNLTSVMLAIIEKKTYIPYRASKLTQLLKESLGGNSKTTIMATISSDYHNLNESLNTIKFATFSKKVQNKLILKNVTEDNSEIK
jgi:kinesin family protein 3/17